MFYSAEGNLCNNKNNKNSGDNDMFYNLNANVAPTNEGGCTSPINNPDYYSNNPKRDSASNKHLPNTSPIQGKQQSLFKDAPLLSKPLSPLSSNKSVETNILTDIVNSGSELLSNFIGLFSNKKTEQPVIKQPVENKSTMSNYSSSVEKFTEDKPSPDYYNKPAMEPLIKADYHLIQDNHMVQANNMNEQVVGFGVVTDFAQVPVKYEILPSNRNKVCESCNAKACSNALPVPYEFDIMTDKLHWAPNTCVSTPTN
jgi:hypothetical protein